MMTLSQLRSVEESALRAHENGQNDYFAKSLKKFVVLLYCIHTRVCVCVCVFCKCEFVFIYFTLELVLVYIFG